MKASCLVVKAPEKMGGMANVMNVLNSGFLSAHDDGMICRNEKLNGWA